MCEHTRTSCTPLRPSNLLAPASAAATVLRSRSLEREKAS